MTGASKLRSVSPTVSDCHALTWLLGASVSRDPVDGYYLNGLRGFSLIYAAKAGEPQHGPGGLQHLRYPAGNP